MSRPAQSLPDNDTREPVAEPTPNAAVAIIHPRAIYSADALQQALGLTSSSLRREVRLGKIQPVYLCGKRFFTGAAVWAWIQRGGPSRGVKPTELANP